ncbi:unnamed protein product [Anisakis simplex]|uniref:H15 domain-containing protein n=1 Tax=Anisakis simplex TaxID=6269 RepID=A0A0M3K197_ANISI|nr:unnamed protein product [Anisakis simplex]
MVITRSAAKAIALKEAQAKDGENDAQNGNKRRSLAQTKTNRVKATKRNSIRIPWKTTNLDDQVSRKKQQKRSSLYSLKNPTKSRTKQPKPKPTKNRMREKINERGCVDNASGTAQNNSKSARLNASHKSEKRKSRKSYCPNQYKERCCSRSKSSSVNEHTQHESGDKSSDSLPKHVRVALTCGVIKAIAEKLRDYEDNERIVEIYISSSDIKPLHKILLKPSTVQATNLPDDALFIRQPGNDIGEPLALSTPRIRNRTPQSAFN